MKARLAICLLILSTVLLGCSTPNRTADRIARFQAALHESESNAVAGTSKPAKEGVTALVRFLSRIDQPDYVTANVSKVYAPQAWLNDTLSTHRGPEEIGAYFVKLNNRMKDFAFAVDDISYAQNDIYIRWRMDYRIPPLSKKPIKTIGMSQLRFDEAGRVLLQQDYWDSAAGVYEHIPGIGSVVGAGRD